MAEMVWTTYVVGGKITSQEVLDELHERMAGYIEGDDDVKVVSDQKRHLTFAGECNYGNDEDLDAFLQEHNFTYKATWSALPGVFDAGIRFWDAQSKAERVVRCDDEGVPVVTVTGLRSILAAGGKLEEVVHALSLAEGDKVPPIVVALEET